MHAQRIVKIAIVTLVLYAVVFGVYVAGDLGWASLESSILLRPEYRGGPHPIWVLSWTKLTAVGVTVLLYAYAVVSMAGRSPRRRDVVSVFVLVALLTVAVILLVLWPELSFVFGSRMRDSAIDNALASALSDRSRGTTIRIAVALVVQLIGTSILAGRARGARPAP